MANTVDYLQYAEGASPNLVSQATYVSAAWRLTGFTPGIAYSAQANKVWRQSAFMAAALATLVSNALNISIFDDANLTGFVSNLSAAIGATPRAARVVTASTNFTLSLADYAVGLNRTSSPAALQATLPTAAANGQEFLIEDLAFNFDAFPVTVVAPGGTAFAGGATSYLASQRGASIAVRFYASTNQWSIRAS